MAECGQVQTLLEALASALVKDAEGNVSLNLGITQHTCDDLEPYIDCENNHIPSDKQILSAIGEDECGLPKLNVNLQIADDDSQDFQFDELKIGDESNYTNFDTEGHQTMVGNARPWRDELGDALSIKVQGVGITTDLTESVVNFDFNAAYNANPALADFLYKNVQLNHDKDLAVSVYPHIHWLQAKNYTPHLLFQYRWQINGGAKTTGWTFLKCNNLAFPYTPGTTIHQISYSAGIPVPVGSNLSDVIQFRIYRDTTNTAGQFTGNCPYNTGGNASVGVLSFDLHFMLNSIGSNEEYIK
jgi:hypothetical protein